ncbi:hypothetical protein A5645_00010 [Mycobacterium asiaticum]|uniref:hypothetical protein n=2 Tax=Mycobacterium asiaticum TaxID=1790 RepID=UPI0007F01BA4|nr:hypothetical protein [Mycobacterium asiaticum]OBK98730.1 hypothetical protein A5645_00010 [Mycobacterium asiaticum]
MSENAIVFGSIALAVLMVLSIVWFVRRAFIRHDPTRAAASVTVVPNAAFELQLPGHPGKLYFRFDITGDTGGYYDLLVTGEIVNELGGTRPFAVKTSPHSKLEGAASARHVITTYALTTFKGSIPLAAVRPGDRAARGEVTEHPTGLLRNGWVYVPRSK